MSKIGQRGSLGAFTAITDRQSIEKGLEGEESTSPDNPGQQKPAKNKPPQPRMESFGIFWTVTPTPAILPNLRRRPIEPKNPSRKQPVADLTNGAELFSHKRLALGDRHVLLVDGNYEKIAPCGFACPHRMDSITCPFFTETVPCLVGCRVKQVLSGEGLEHEELDVFVVSQAGHYLVTEELILNLDNPRSSMLRVIRDKRGLTVHGATGYQGSLLDAVPAIILGEESEQTENVARVWVPGEDEPEGEPADNLGDDDS